jgi:hypothetical protein
MRPLTGVAKSGQEKGPRSARAFCSARGEVASARQRESVSGSSI